MMNLIVILAFSVLLPSSILCGTIATSEIKSRSLIPQSTRSSPLLPPSIHSKEFNSSQPISRTLNARLKREIPAAASNDILYPDYRITSATGLNKFIFVRMNSVDKSAPSSPEIDAATRENDNFSGDVTRALARGSSIDRFPAALIERRGQTAEKDRRVYLRCFFNAVSCFKR